jgi:hypothetical protein
MSMMRGINIARVTGIMTDVYNVINMGRGDTYIALTIGIMWGVYILL